VPRAAPLAGLVALVVASAMGGCHGAPPASPPPLAAGPGVEVAIRAGDPAAPALVVERRHLVLPAGARWVVVPGLGGEVRELSARVLDEPAATVRAAVVDAAAGQVRLLVDAPRAGEGLVELRYATPGLSAWVEHTLAWDAAGAALAPGPSRPTLTSTVALANRSGHTLRGAHVTLVEAGRGGRVALPDPVDLAGGAEVRVPLAAPAPVEATRVVVFDGAGGSIALQAQELDAAYGTTPAPPRAERELRLPGLSRPPGPVRLLEAGLFIGQTELVADPGGARIPLGAAPGITGRRLRLEVRWKTRRLLESFAVTVRNDGATDEPVVIRELAYRSPSWRLVESSVPAVPAGERVIDLPVLVPAGRAARVTLVVEYNW
jgi:hypothetical protein